MYSDGSAVYVPDGVLVGHDAVDKFAGDLRATHPHFVYTPHGDAQALGNMGIVAWGSGPKGEPPEYTGLDVIIVRDGKIDTLYVVLNPNLSVWPPDSPVRAPRRSRRVPAPPGADFR